VLPIAYLPPFEKTDSLHDRDLALTPDSLPLALDVPYILLVLSSSGSRIDRPERIVVRHKALSLRLKL
jgi:hypothetical protein